MNNNLRVTYFFYSFIIFSNKMDSQRWILTTALKMGWREYSSAVKIRYYVVIFAAQFEGAHTFLKK